jgi:hypothetical protein
MKRYKVRFKFASPNLPMAWDYYTSAVNSFEALKQAAAHGITEGHPFYNIRYKVISMEAIEDVSNNARIGW